MKPIIILAFSNSQDAYLDNIKQERAQVSKALDDLNDSNAIGVRKIAHLSNEQLFYYINRYRKQVRMLHFAGHASGSSLQLEARNGDEYAYSEGIAGLLGQCNTLDLVFLNGCATYGQVETLFSKGVKAVIATSVAINDTKALEFSVKFYEALAVGETIGNAFDAAKSYLEQISKKSTFAKSKGLKLRREKTTDTIPWGIYVNEGCEYILDRKLPTEPYRYTEPEASNTLYKPNRNLLYTVFKSSLKHNQAFVSLAKEARSSGKKLETPDLQLALLSHFPASISTQLRELFSDKLAMKSRKHLQQLVNTYQSVLITIGSTLLAELWDAVRKQSIQLNEQQKVIVRQYFDQNVFDYQSFDWLLLIDNCLQAFQQHFELEPFNPKEISDKSFYHILSQFFPEGLRQNATNEAANQYLLDMFEELQKKSIDSEKISSFCEQAELHLTKTLDTLSILTHYKMAVVKEIKVNKFKHNPPSFSHRVVGLDSNMMNNLNLERQRLSDEYTDTCSVQIFQDNFINGVNLFPFIIDKHSFKQVTNSKTYFFAYREGNERLIYRFLANWNEKPFAININTDDDILMNDEDTFKVVHEQFFQAKRDLLGEGIVKGEESNSAEEEDDFADIF